MRETMFYKRFARLLLVCVILLSFGMTARAAHAGTSVDPATLNPPVPPELNPVCTAAGSGTICTISFVQYDQPGGIGVFCGSGTSAFELMGDGGTETTFGRWYYDQNNNLVMRNFNTVSVGSLSNPKTGDRLDTYQNNTAVQQTDPGIIYSGVYKISGTNKFSIPKGATVFLDTGTTVLSATDGSIVRESAHHPIDQFFAGDTSALQPICDALSR